MSDYIPFDIQAKIMKNLPTKSLIQFRSVSKAWKSLIDSTEFITDHHKHTHQRHNCLLVRDPEHNYVSIVDDDTFPQDKFSLTLPMSARKPRILGSSQGLFCLYSYVTTAKYSGIGTAAIWNPAIRKLVDIDQLPRVVGNMVNVTVGFGVCPRTLDPKILKVSIPFGLQFTGNWQVEVFRLSLGTWTSLSNNLPPGISFSGNQVAIDNFIYWPASNRNVMSFDLTREEFAIIHLSDVILAHNFANDLHIYKLKESLAVLQSHSEEPHYYGGPDYDVWIMDNSPQKSFRKIYALKFNMNYAVPSVLEFRKNGEPIILISDNYNICEALDLPHQNRLFVYKHNLRHISSLGISSNESSFFVSSYAETLLLLDH